MKTREEVLKEVGVNTDRLKDELPLLYKAIECAMEKYVNEHIRDLTEQIKDLK